jgi:hypothetical protein
VQDSVISNNQSHVNPATYSSRGGGGAINVLGTYYTDGPGTLRIIGSTLSDNASSEGGAIDFNTEYSEGNLIVEDSTLSNNVAEDDGGAISFRADTGEFLVVNSTISGNDGGPSGSGGGIQFEDDNGASLNIENSTVVNNVAGASGGGVYSEDTAFVLTNTIVANNTAPSMPDVGDGLGGTSVSSTYSLIGDTSGVTITDLGGSLLDTAPSLGPLANNGGSTLTHLPLAGSPVLNAGTPAAPALANDQRGAGFPRVLDGRVEIGAVEIPAPVIPPVTGGGGGAEPIPALSGWLLWLLGLLVPGLALRYRSYLEQR